MGGPLKSIMLYPVGTTAVLSLLVFLFSSCSDTSTEPEVVIYASIDQHHAEPILKAFEAETGIRVLAVYDIEASKTTGLVNRLIAEGDRPRADVFWSGEFVQTILLKEKDILAPYRSPEAEAIPAQYRDPGDYWTGFAGRARVILVNHDRLPGEKLPSSIFDFEESEWPADQTAIALPFFGTTATQAAALFTHFGAERASRFFQTVSDRGVQILDGNSTVRDQVASGRLLFGLTDTDDACGAIERGAPVTVVLPDQDQLGTLVVPNTVALVKGGPNPETARQLIDYLLKPETERRMVEMGWSHAPLRPMQVESKCFELGDVKGMDVSLAAVYDSLETSKQQLREIFIR